MTLDEYFAEPGAKTPAGLSDEVGLSESSLSRIRRGKQNITRDVILRIIDATGGKVTADGLLGLHGRCDELEWPLPSPNNAGEIIRSEPASETEAGTAARPFAQTSSRTGSLEEGEPAPQSASSSLASSLGATSTPRQADAA